MHILWIKNELLHPVDRGGKIRAYQMLRWLIRHHRVTYLTLDNGTGAADAVERAAEYATEVMCVPFRVAPRGSLRFYAEVARNLASRLPYSVARYHVPAFARQIERFAQRPDIDIVVCDFLAPAVNLPARLGKPWILFQHNIEAEIWRRHAEVARNPLLRAHFRSQWRRTVRFERETCRRADHVVAVSDADRDHFRSAYGVERASSIPTGVDTEYFRPPPGTPRAPQRVVFVGALDWMPNEDGMRFFVDDVWPAIRRAVPEATLQIVGRNPTPAVQRMASTDTGIEVTGSVPDVRPFLAGAAICVVPLRVGGGTRLKIYEAMAMECAVVSTSVGAEGLPVEDGRHLAIADTAPAFAERCVDLLRDPAGAAKLARAGATYVRSHFDWEKVAEAFAGVCEGVRARS